MDYKVVVVGESGVGKSCIVKVVVRDTFISDSAYTPTIVDYYRKNVTFGRENYLLDISDTAGDDIYAPITENHIRKGDCFLCVFSVHDKDSFTKIEFFMNNINLLKPNKPVILIGNKCDKDRVVTWLQCQQRARDYKVPYNRNIG